MPAPPADGVPADQVCGILLAAGQGRRFDASGRDNKLLARLDDGATVVETAARRLLAVLPVVAVVRQQGEVAQRLAVLGCHLVSPANAAAGMSASLVSAIEYAAAASGWLIALGDMPFVQSATHRSLLQALLHGAGIAVPVYQGQRGNPVGFGRRHLAALRQLQGDRGAYHLLQQFPVQPVAVSDAGIQRDIDTRADLFQG